MPLAERLLDLAIGIGLLVQGRADEQRHPPCIRHADFLGHRVSSGLSKDDARHRRKVMDSSSDLLRLAAFTVGSSGIG
jgi:hypothetical protein